MNEKQAKKIMEEEKDFPVRSKVFRNVKTGEYETIIPIMELNDYVEVK